MRKIVVDTNIYYSLLDVYPNPKVIADCLKSFDIFVTTSSLIEVVLRHQNNLDLLKRLLAPVVNNEIKIISTGFPPFSSEEIQDVFYAKSTSEIHYIIERIRLDRAELEAERLYIYFILFVTAVAEVFKKKFGYEFKDELLNNLQGGCFKRQLESSEKMIIDAFRKVILNAKNPDLAVRQEFNEQLMVATYLFIVNFYQISLGVIQTSGHVVELKIQENYRFDNDELNAKLASDRSLKKFSKNRDNFMNIILNLNCLRERERYFDSMKEGIALVPNVSKTEKDFVLSKLKRTLNSGAKINKNDIFDCCISHALELDGYLLLTLDADFIKVLEQISPESFKLIQELGLN